MFLFLTAWTKSILQPLVTYEPTWVILLTLQDGTIVCAVHVTANILILMYFQVIAKTFFVCEFW